MERITVTQLRHLAETLNEITDSPATGWAQSENGQNRAHVGHYEISQAYGGYCLHRIESESGGVSDVFRCGHVPARDLYNRMRAYMAGMADAAQDAAETK